MQGIYFLSSFVRGLCNTLSHKNNIVSISHSDTVSLSRDKSNATVAILDCNDIFDTIVGKDCNKHIDMSLQDVQEQFQLFYSACVSNGNTSLLELPRSYTALKELLHSGNPCILLYKQYVLHVQMVFTDNSTTGSAVGTKNRHIQEKIVFITGAAQGLGKGIAEYFLQNNCIVYIADIDIVQAKKTAHELISRNTHVHDYQVYALELDCSNEESVKHCSAYVAQHTAGIDILISNAGKVISGDIETMSTHNFYSTINVNYTGYFLLVKYFTPLMKAYYYGNPYVYSDIIQINSKSGLQGSLKNFAYAGSKFGGIGLTQSFALELIDFNIKVNAICPGNLYDGSLWSHPKKGLFKQYLDTGKVSGAKTIEDVRSFYIAKTPIKRACTIEDVVKGIVYLIDQNFEIGQALPISGGQIMLH